MLRPVFKSAYCCLALVFLVTGCASVKVPSLPQRAGLKDKITVIAETETYGMDPIATAAFWGTRFDRDPNNPVFAVEFSRALRAIGNNEESLRVIQRTANRLDNDADMSLELGKSLIANDRAFEAIRPLKAALALGKSNDWRAYSAYGVALDKTGEHAQALIEYDRALSLSPDQAQVLNNKGLSYALAGRKVLAERALRTATAGPGGTARIRQNYALVLALKGNTQQAERLARADLPPSIADGNVAYYRQLVSKPSYWQDLSGTDAVQPDFGADPATLSTTPLSAPILTPGGPTRPVRPRPSVAPVQEQPTRAPDPEVSASAASTAPQSIAASGAPVPLAFSKKESAEKSGE